MTLQTVSSASSLSSVSRSRVLGTPGITRLDAWDATVLRTLEMPVQQVGTDDDDAWEVAFMVKKARLAEMSGIIQSEIAAGLAKPLRIEDL